MELFVNKLDMCLNKMTIVSRRKVACDLDNKNGTR